MSSLSPFPSFPAFFSAATGHSPYPWQERLALDPVCQSRLIDIPTGLGKTAGVILAWLWNRLNPPSGISGLPSPIPPAPTGDPWPRRLVFCLPMRTLVEQTESNVAAWVGNLWTHRAELNLSSEALAELAWMSAGGDPTEAHSPIVLMGGEDLNPAQREWDLYPEKPAIIIGTQDMLLSRALNRGYGMSRYRWPMHFALLNNDALWVLDEVQLMGPGLAATTQLEGFRRAAEFKVVPCHSWWMSATIAQDWLATVDFPKSLLEHSPIQLGPEKDNHPVKALRKAPKVVEGAGLAPGLDEKATARLIADRHSNAGLNLVVVNTVRRARNLHAALVKALPKGSVDPLLLHSQFRPEDRRRVLDSVRAAPPGSVVVSTQVIEAGVDLSCHTLFTELAPWSSLVQRFGRCNRWLNPEGLPFFSDARIFWFDLDADKQAAPYDPDQLLAARSILSGLSSAALGDIEPIPPTAADRPQFRHVIRRKDLLELFDTTPDLAGADLDIDRFIRDADQSHVSVFWRDWSGHSPNGESGTLEPPPRREEICPTGVADLRALLGKEGVAWRWNFLDHHWESCKDSAILPGQTYLLHVSQGGYHPVLGWTGDSKLQVAPAVGPAPPNVPTNQPPNSTKPAGYDSDPDSDGAWQTIAQHTDQVCHETWQIASALGRELKVLSKGNADLSDALHAAARWHDWGKAHPAFQGMLRPEQRATAALEGPPAKAPNSAWRIGRLPEKPSADDVRRRHFRHELASALALLHPTSGFPFQDRFFRDLAAYLVAAHHGKVRLSIRSLPGEWIPPRESARAADRRFARGVWDADILPTTDLGGGTIASSVELSLEPMELGLCEAPPFENEPSWAERVLDLRDALGPFALAYLETLLRAADARASVQGAFSLAPSHTVSACAREEATKFEESSPTLAKLSSADTAHQP